MGKKTETKKGQMSSEPEMKLVQMRDHDIQFPELYLNVYISQKEEEAQFAPMFARAWCNAVSDPYDADLVVFTGGPDVNPALYNAEAHPMTKWDKTRDNEDMQLYADCFIGGVPMLGICRGAQFLHVMNNGRLFQHIDGHVGDHYITDTRENISIARTSSTHHQAVMRNNRMKVLAVCSKSSTRWSDPGVREEGYYEDVEAFFYSETCCLGIQGHPEFSGYTAFTKWSLDQIHRFICENPDIHIDGGKYRLKRQITLGSSEEK